jgi:Na+-translocating ferredoxin:NAD+ oxidoreductase RNF subunit RnfB
MVIAIAVIVVTVIGILCAVMLSVASKVMAVEVDERVVKVRECLPGANCGGCGFAGCDGYAAALVEDPDMALTLCAPGGAAAAQAMAAVLGKEAGEMVAKAAFVHCKGDCEATSDKMEYRGIKTCSAAKLMFGGAGKCTFGCMGLGDCAAACPSDAICIENGIAHVDVRACTGCGVCANTCPNNVISILPVSAPVKVACSNKDKGAVVRKKCTAGCIGCGMCMKKCPEGAITVANNLASIDYDKCTGCGTCAAACPVKCRV